MTITFLIMALIALCVIGAFVWFALWIIGKMGLPEPFNKVAIIIVCLIALVAVIAYLFPGVLPIR